MDTFLNSVIFLSGAGMLIGAGLSYAAQKFAVHLNPVEEEIIKLLPGANCGACGIPGGCAGYAEALASGRAAVGKCPVLEPETNKRIAGLLGREVVEKERTTAVIFCGGGENCKDKFVYEGIEDCSVAAGYFGGGKECDWGCLGLGTCAKVCPFGAIRWSRGAVPVIDEEKCASCGICVTACPKKLIHIIPCRFRYHVRCASWDKGARVRQICLPGCIGCNICVKICPKNDIILENNLAKMKYVACDNCGLCEQKCPTKTIKKMNLQHGSSAFVMRNTPTSVGAPMEQIQK